MQNLRKEMQNYKIHKRDESRLLEYLVNKCNNPDKYKVYIKRNNLFSDKHKSYLTPCLFEHNYLIIERMINGLSPLEVHKSKKLEKAVKEDDFKYVQEIIKKIKNKQSQERYRENPLNKLASNLRNLIGGSLKNKGFKKKTKTYKILGCEYNFFIKWLNYDKQNEDLHLDHIVPVSLGVTQNEIELLNHYSNFQLLKSKQNIIKGNRYIYGKNLKKVLENHPNKNLIKKIVKRSKIKIIKQKKG